MSNNFYTDKYDIFLSYRRDGGETMAILLRERLNAKGYKVFLDIESLNSGSFNKKLLSVIENCTDVVVVCSKNSLDRCVNEGDWVRAEIAHAFNHGKNVVPIMLRGFSFPDNLPDDIKEISVQNGVNANSSEYFDAAIERLTKTFLVSKPSKKSNPVKLPKWLLPGAASLAAVGLIIGGIALFGGNNDDAEVIAPATDIQFPTEQPQEHEPVPINDNAGGSLFLRELEKLSNDSDALVFLRNTSPGGGIATHSQIFFYKSGCFFRHWFYGRHISYIPAIENSASNFYNNIRGGEYSLIDGIIEAKMDRDEETGQWNREYKIRLSDDGNISIIGEGVEYVYYGIFADEVFIPNSNFEEMAGGFTSVSADNNTEINLHGNTIGNIAGGGGSIAKQGDWIYYRNSKDYDSLYKVRTDGSENTKLYEGSVRSVNVIDDRIYFIQSETLPPPQTAVHIYRLNTDGTGATKLFDNSLPFNTGLVNDIFVVGDWIYYLNLTSLMRMRTDGTDTTKLTDKNVTAFNVVGDWIYFFEFGQDKYLINKIRTNGSEETLLLDYNHKVFNLLVIGDWMYYTKLGSDNMYKLRTDGSEEIAIKNSEWDSDRWHGGINNSDELIYFSYGGITNRRVYTMNTDGSNLNMFSDTTIRTFAIFDDWFYYFDDSNNLIRIRTDGTERQLLN
jgi:hypothetical protein